jgi:transcriptional antiterminator RfaH
MRFPASSSARLPGVDPAALADGRWYAVQSQPRREQLALLHLARQGFEAFCPMVSRVGKVGRAPRPAQTPFFPGYLFVRLDLEQQRWRSINGTIGVMRLVAFGSGGRPAPLPEGFVERLQELDRGGALPADELKAGDRVRVIGGPLDDVCGVLEASSGQERVTILLTLLGQETRVSLGRGSLIAA